jgi:predicted transcriptional regulator
MASSFDDTPDSEGTTPGACPPQLESPRTKLVYLYLSAVGEADLETLHERLHVDRLNLYPVLGLLVDRGLVEREGTNYRRSRDDD